MALGLVEMLKNSDLVIETKTAAPNQSSKQPDWPDTMWKFYFTLQINE